MDIWINLEINEGMAYPSTHLTEQGALIAQIDSILDFLDAEHSDTNPTQWHNCLANWGLDEGHWLWQVDITKWRSRSVEEMREFRSRIVELTWDAGCVEYVIERTEVQP